MFKAIIFSALLCLMSFSGVLATPRQSMEVQGMTDIREFKEVPEDTRMSLVITFLVVNGKGSSYVGKIHSDYITWNGEDQVLTGIFFSKDKIGVVWFTLFTPKLIFRFRDSDGILRKYGRYLLQTISMSDASQTQMVIQ
jgi:hypothetical protein